MFTPTVDGTVSAIRFFKGVQNTGTHVGTLWTAAGVPLGTVTFQNETPSGWQRAALSEPVPVTAGTAYVVSYYAPNGRYSATPGFFNEARTSGDLTTAAGAARFRYGTGGGFPTGSFGSPSYFVDVELGGSHTARHRRPDAGARRDGCRRRHDRVRDVQRGDRHRPHARPVASAGRRSPGRRRCRGTAGR